MERIVELRGLEGVYCSDVVHAYMSCNAETFFDLVEESKNGMVDRETYMRNCI